MRFYYYLTVFSLLFGESSCTSASMNTSSRTTSMKSIPRPLIHRMHQLQHDAMDDLLQRTESISLESSDVESKSFL